MTWKALKRELINASTHAQKFTMFIKVQSPQQVGALQTFLCTMG